MRPPSLNWRFGPVTFFLAFALVTFSQPSAAPAAITGSIEGIGIDPSLTQASVGNLSADYDQCAEEQDEELVCYWAAVAMLVPPWDSACPANSAFELAPGLPGRQPDATRVWSGSASADGTLESGPLTFPLDDLDDEHLCLYVIRDVESPRAPGEGYVPLVMTSQLVASDLLHVDLPPGEPQPPASATPPAGSTAPPAVCKKHQVRRHRRCVNRKHRRKQQRRQDRSH
jgi:hypothetical protein